jgi:TolB-like protein
MEIKRLGVYLLVITCIVSAQNKPSIAILELDASGISKTDASVLSDRLQSELINTQKFVVMERAKVAEILNEQGFQASGCTSTDCAVEVGKLVGVEQMVAGNIGKLGEIYTINARLIRVQTGEVLKTAIVDRRCSIEVVLTQCMREAALQLSGDRGPVQRKITLQDKPEEIADERPKKDQPDRRRQTIPTNEHSLLLGAGWGTGTYTVPATFFPDNHELNTKMKNQVIFLFAFNLSDHFRANFSYLQSKIDDEDTISKYTGTLKTYYPRLLFFPWDWLYFSYGYAFTTLNLDISPAGFFNSVTESKTNSESKSALAIGFDFRVLKRFHLIYDYNMIQNNNHSAFTIAFAF